MLGGKIVFMAKTIIKQIILSQLSIAVGILVVVAMILPLKSYAETSDGSLYSQFSEDGEDYKCPSDEHNWDDGKVILEPTAYARGVKEYTCTVCGEARAEALDRLAGGEKYATDAGEIEAGNFILATDIDLSKATSAGNGYSGTPLFRVLKVEKGRLLLMSEYLWGGGKGGDTADSSVKYNENSPEADVWQGSNAQSWCNAFKKDILEQIQGINVLELEEDIDDKAYDTPASLNSGWAASFSSSQKILKKAKDQVFFLSAEEVYRYMPFEEDKIAYKSAESQEQIIWWLRSPDARSDNHNEPGAVWDGGLVNGHQVDEDAMARPVFYASINENRATISKQVTEGKIIYKLEPKEEGDSEDDKPIKPVVQKKDNPLAVKGRTAKVKYSKLKKKKQTLAIGKVVSFTGNGQGQISYLKTSGNKKITINKKTGKITIKKGLKKGTYKVNVKISATGNAEYKPAVKVTTIKIKVK